MLGAGRVAIRMSYSTFSKKIGCRVEGVCSRIETVYSSRSSCFPVLKPDTSEGIARDLSDVIS